MGQHCPTNWAEQHQCHNEYSFVVCTASLFDECSVLWDSAPVDIALFVSIGSLLAGCTRLVKIILAAGQNRQSVM